MVMCQIAWRTTELSKLVVLCHGQEKMEHRKRKQGEEMRSMQEDPKNAKLK